MNYRLIILSFSTLLTSGTLNSCIDPVSFQNNKKVEVLVVEGNVNTEYGYHFVKLTRTAKYGDVFAGVISPETDADIYVRDDLGNVIVYSEINQGLYRSDEKFAGVTGRSYSLFIETREGKEYISTPENIAEAPEIDSLFYAYKKVPSTDQYGNIVEKQGVEVMVRFKDAVNDNNFYRWNTKGTYKFKSNPELFTPPGSRSPQPKPCCAICWKSEYNPKISVATDKLFEGEEFIQTILFLEDDGARFYEKYFIEVEQRSISKEAYQFYSLLKTQLEVSGSIFDAPPTEINGNVISLSDPGESVIGHFSAYGVKRSSLFIMGDKLPYRNSPPVIRDDCRVVENATAQQPLYW